MEPALEGTLVLIAKDRGDFAHAARLGDEGLILHRQLGDRRGMARTMYNLSTIAYWQGEYARSKALAEQAACIFADLGDFTSQGLMSVPVAFGEAPQKLLAQRPDIGPEE